jgi:ferrous iron transport protein B
VDQHEQRPHTAGDSAAVAERLAPLVALVGPPNSGKTTLFNQLTGLRQKVANYPGVTVEKKVGKVSVGDDREIDLVDLPGVHGFSARTLDERVTRDVLEGRVDGIRPPDALVLIVDSTRLENQLMLVEPVLELGLPTLLVLNMCDELEERGGRVDDAALAARLGVDILRTSARSGVGVEAVRRYLGAIDATRGAAEHVERRLTNVPRGVTLPVVDAFAARRRLVREVVDGADFVAPGVSKISERLDSVFLHRLWGPTIFLAVVVLVFQSIFTWAVPLMDGIEFLIATSGGWLGATLPDTWYRSLLVDGVWAGVGSVVIFLPQILILFLFLGILEDSGYMARAAVIADRTMYRVGLQGRAFLPLLSGYACAVPAILAARTIDDERDRMATIFVTPFMTCSARLPVYALLIAAFIPAEPLLGPFFGKQAATMMGLYAIGIVAAIGTAFLLKRTILKAEPGPFLMELPPYRIPSPRTLALRLLDRSKIFFRRAGRIIFSVAIVLWTLTQFPRTEFGPPDIEQSALGQIGHFIEPAIEPLGFDWRIGVGIVTSLAAREVIIGTLGTIYGVETADEEAVELQEILKRDLEPAAAVGLLVFFAFALQCMSTVAMVRRETAGWKWPLLQFSYMLFLGYAGAFIAYRIF